MDNRNAFSKSEKIEGVLEYIVTQNKKLFLKFNGMRLEFSFDNLVNFSDIVYFLGLDVSRVFDTIWNMMSYLGIDDIFIEATIAKFNDDLINRIKK